MCVKSLIVYKSFGFAPLKSGEKSFKYNPFLASYMKGIISSFKRGKTTQTDNQMIIVVESVDTRDEASKLVGKKVVYTTESGKKITGTVKSAHGKKGAVRTLFEKGMPGQALGKEVSIE